MTNISDYCASLTPGAMVMVISGIIAVALIQIVLPIQIIFDQRRLFGKRSINVVFGLIALFIPLLSLFLHILS